MLLAIHTATAACSVALLDGGAVLAECHEQVGRGHAERLLPMIAALPGGGRADEILVDIGPGSFTGIRVGLAAARALGFGWGATVHGYSALAALAWAALADASGGPIVAVLAGGHGELFVQRFSGDPFRAEGALGNLPPVAAAAFVGDDRIAGPGAPLLSPLLGRAPAADAAPRAAIAAELPAAYRTLSPVPRYGRAPDATLPG